MTDVIGILDRDDDVVVVVSERGERVQVTRDQVVALKELTTRPIRTSEIRALEHAAADGWPGLEQEWIDGWILKAGNGFTGRANSATPLSPEAGDRSLETIRAWYGARGLEPRLLLPDRLGTVPAGWQAGPDVLVMAADVTDFVPPQSPPVDVGVSPDEQWLGAYHYHGEPVPDTGLPVLQAVRQGTVGFIRLGETTTTLAVTRAAVTTAPDGRRWVGLTAVEVAAAHRRRGLGTLVCAAAVEWGRERGATHAYLQVESSNEAAVTMYRGLGFVDHHRYRYVVPLG
ncbi:N-acetyltransferase [Rhodococcoides trifolii]|uniref:N-acetyltransferase n=2 Tax=Rhodococcoides trifolii TaxID=908250 RepID=A0A917CQ26_9NOCA|nr:N-acetyltransferase [Rhodococcus trifolii]